MSGFAANRLAMPLLALLAAITIMPVPALAHRMHLNEMITGSSVQRTWMRAMGADIMRAALKIDERDSLERLREVRGRMAESIDELRRGGEELKGRGVAEADQIIATVNLVAQQWAALDDALLPMLDAGAIDVAHSDELLALNGEVAGTIEELHMIFHHAANHYGVVTVIGMAVMTTERERALSQRITSTFLDIARSSDAAERAALGEAMVQFEALLGSLTHGNPELGLMPAPTHDLRRQWRVVDAVWQQMKPLLAAAAAGERQGRAEIDRVSELGASLMTELGRAGDMLSALVPGSRT